MVLRSKKSDSTGSENKAAALVTAANVKTAEGLSGQTQSDILVLQQRSSD